MKTPTQDALIDVPSGADIARTVVVGDGGYENPDGRHVEAPAGTTFVEAQFATSPHSRVRVEIALPRSERWDGRLVGTGNGGAAGSLPSANPEFAMHLRRGRAVVTTDLGTWPDPVLAGVANPETWKDFGHRATHIAMQAGREAVCRFYGRPPKYTYFCGGSTGGQQAMSLAQRHPEDCDAIIAAVPAHARTDLHAYFLWNWQALHKPDGAELFTDAQEKSWQMSVLEAFAPAEKLERAKGRFVSDPRWTKPLFENALSIALQRDKSLSQDHIEALRKICQGPRHQKSGRTIALGIPPGASFGPACGNLWIFEWFFGAGTNPATLDFGYDFDRYKAAMAPDLDAESVDLDDFRRRGGKLFLYSGSADSCVPWHFTASWFNRLVNRFGGDLERVHDFCRYYILPGRAHSGGSGIQTIRDEFDLVMRWREKNIPPCPIGHGMTPPSFDLPLTLVPPQDLTAAQL